MKTYPSWRYHRTLPACIVADPDADDALGEGWADTPAAFLEPEPAAETPVIGNALPEHGAAILNRAIAEHTLTVHREEPTAKHKPAHTTKTKRKHR